MKSNIYSNILINFSIFLILVIVLCSANDVSPDNQNDNSSSTGRTMPTFASDLSEGN